MLFMHATYECYSRVVHEQSTHTRAHTCTQTQTPLCIHTHTYTHTHVRTTCAHAHTHTHAHTYTHVHTQTRSRRNNPPTLLIVLSLLRGKEDTSLTSVDSAELLGCIPVAEIVHLNSTSANITQIPSRILQEIRPDRDPHCFFAATEEVLQDNAGNLPPFPDACFRAC